MKNHVEVLCQNNSPGNGSLEQDGPHSIVAMEEKEQTRLMHQHRFGKRERHADKTSQTLAQRIIPALHMDGLSRLFSHVNAKAYNNSSKRSVI